MINIKLNYTIVQSVDVIFAVMSYMLLNRIFHIETDPHFWNVAMGAAVVAVGIYVYYTNRIFYLMLRDG